MSQIKSKIWKQLSHIKNQQIKDNDSQISNSRSMTNSKFSKVKFSKMVKKQQKPTRADSVKQFKALSSINHYSRYKYINPTNQNNMSILNQSKNKIIDNSLNQSYHKQNKQSYRSKNKQNIIKKSSIKSNKQLNTNNNINEFMKNIKNVYNEIKQITEYMVGQFEKIKEDMQKNMEKVVMEIVNIKFNSINKDNSNDNQLEEVNDINKNNLINQINQIFRIGFLSIKKNINILPQSLSYMNSNSNNNNNNYRNKSITNNHNSNSITNNPNANTNLTPKSSSFNQSHQISRYFKKQLQQYTSSIKPTPNTKILNQQSRKSIIDQMGLIESNESIYHAITQRKSTKKIQRMSSFDKQIDQSPIQKFKKYQNRQNKNINNYNYNIKENNNIGNYKQNNIKKKLIEQITISKKQNNQHQVQQYTDGLKNAVYRLKEIIQFGEIQ